MGCLMRTGSLRLGVVFFWGLGVPAAWVCDAATANLAGRSDRRGRDSSNVRHVGGYRAGRDHVLSGGYIE